MVNKVKVELMKLEQILQHADGPYFMGMEKTMLDFIFGHYVVELESLIPQYFSQLPYTRKLMNKLECWDGYSDVEEKYIKFYDSIKPEIKNFKRIEGLGHKKNKVSEHAPKIDPSKYKDPEDSDGDDSFTADFEDMDHDEADRLKF